MLRQAITAAALLAAMPAAASSWTVEPAESSIAFTFTQSGAETPGQFTDFSASITFDPQDLGKASISAEIDIASFSTGNGQIDGAVAGQDWFATGTFPKAQFVSSAVMAEGDGYVIQGDLTIRDMTVPIELKGTIAIDGGRAEALMAVELNRTAFGVGQGSFEDPGQVGHEVPVVITIVASQP